MDREKRHALGLTAGVTAGDVMLVPVGRVVRKCARMEKRDAQVKHSRVMQPEPNECRVGSGAAGRCCRRRPQLNGLLCLRASRPQTRTGNGITFLQVKEQRHKRNV